VCSSGTAAANFYPAVVEAHYAHVPLLVLTADRPHELRDSGANQTVDQVKLYGDHVLWAYDVALPEANPPELALRNLRTLAARAYALADGMPKGAVHLNFPFRKPLEPTAVTGEGREIAWGIPSPQTSSSSAEGTPYTAPLQDAAPRIERGMMLPTEAQIERLVALLDDSERVLVICGPRCPAGDFPARANRLAVACGWVVLADVLSGVRYHPDQTNIIGDYELFIQQARAWQAPDVVLHFGAMPTSQPLLDYLSSIRPQYRISISADGVWTDFDHRLDFWLHAEPTAVCTALIERFGGQPAARPWYDQFAQADMRVERAFHELEAQTWLDALVPRQVISALPDGSSLFLASSLTVRHVDQFGFTAAKAIRVFCNRGASGIDGTISSALGVAASKPDTPTVLIIGDLAFYHDMNALLAAKRNGIRNLVIVLLNNNGGQIFRRLPIHNEAFEPAFTDLFITPHGLTFEHTAAQFGFAYARTDDREAFRTAFEAALTNGEPSIIEVVTDAEEDARRRKAIMDRVTR
jgi:2-succinyl-5-enolpyruvyl-6-hydroxy-3-cyclohexene-1-carboxylate synthase